MKRAIAIIFLVLLLPAAGQAGGLDFSLSTASIEIGALYNGTTLTVEGSAPQGADVVLRFTGAPAEVSMKQKGKAFGLLWMNMNTLHFSHLAKVCLIESSTDLASLGQVSGQLGLEGLIQKVGIEPEPSDRQGVLAELLKLKEHEGLYRQSSGAVVLGEKTDLGRKFSAKLDIPSRLSPGDYVVEFFAVQGGQVLAQAVRPIEVKMVGIPAFLGDLAFNHGAWYGILASIIAILAGLAIGLVFQSKGAH